MFFYILIAVFVAGLMVGRTPEYLGKKIEAREIKLAAVGALFVPTMALILTAHLGGHRAGLASIYNAGAHGFTEALYAYTRSRTTTAVRSPATARPFSAYLGAVALYSAGSCRCSPRSRSAARWPARRRIPRRPERSAPTGHLRGAARRHHRPHRRPDDLPGADAWADRGGAVADLRDPRSLDHRRRRADGRLRTRLPAR